jgi:hypothetical protein
MTWLRWYLARGDVLAILLCLALICVVAIGLIWFPQLQNSGSNAGFGPEWECKSVPQGDPICVKKPVR